MTALRRRSPSVVVLAIAGAVVLAMTSVLTAAFVVGIDKLLAPARLLADEGWVMGGTGGPEPPQGYIDQVTGLYLQPDPPLFDGQTTFPGYDVQGLATPEQFCPVVCIDMPANLPQEWNDLSFGDSLNVGVDQLNNAIEGNVDGSNVVLGFSQSATIATIEMQHLAENPPDGLNPDELNFELLGDPNSPIGGILTRFEIPGVTVPGLNIPLGIGETPTDAFPTDIYTGEYDGYADFPQDPTNLLADLNALIGIATVHPYYPDPEPGVNLDTDHIIDLGTIDQTNFYEIPAPLPMLAFMYDGGAAGMFFYDLFNPWLSLVNNWAYGNPGDPDAGISIDGNDPIGETGPWAATATGHLADINGAAGILPSMDPLQVLAGMEYAAAQTLLGPLNDFTQDVGVGPLPDAVNDTVLFPYTLTNDLDQFLLTEWNDLATSLGVEDSLGPDAIFDGAPLI
jgi:hypothetical protein